MTLSALNILSDDFGGHLDLVDCWSTDADLVTIDDQ